MRGEGTILGDYATVAVTDTIPTAGPEQEKEQQEGKAIESKDEVKVE